MHPIIGQKGGIENCLFFSTSQEASSSTHQEALKTERPKGHSVHLERTFN